MSRRVTRRQFIRTSAAAGVALAGVHSFPTRGRAYSSPNEKLNLAFVGVANKGGDNVAQLAAENVAVLCDVDERYLDAAAQQHPKAAKYRDYRRMLDKEAKNVDAVVVSTADHSHAPPTSIALDLGKHVYCEKPLTHTVQEARVIAELAKKNKLATQMGTQIHAGGNYRRVVEAIQSGAIGQVTAVHNWCNKGWSNGRFGQVEAAPDYLDWNVWLGPAKERKYSAQIHPADWRRFWEYGSGTFGDMACHVMDLPFWALNLRHPSSVEAQGPEVHPDGAPSWCKCSYKFPVEDGKREIEFTWSDGGEHFDLVKQTKDHDGQPLANWGLGVLFVGDNGMMAADYGRYQLLPQDKFSGYQPPQPTIPDSIGHWAEWAKACKTGETTTCNFDYSGALTEAVLLGVVAYRMGQKLEWNAKELKAANCPQAEAMVKKEYRKGFEVVGIG